MSVFQMKMPDKSDTAMAVDISGLCFSWRDRHNPVLEIDCLQIQREERIFIQGPSGSGKSTLLSLIAGVVTPQRGRIRVNDHHLNALNSAARDRFRADNIGYIYQMFNLIPYLSVIENVTLPCRFSKSRQDRAATRAGSCEAEAIRLLDQLGMDGKALFGTPVTDLSVGQQQRVAAARALIGAPEVIIADEPTSSLDASHREAFIQLLFKECDREKTTLVFVSHDTALGKLFDKTFRIEDINAITA
jgi:putative ABC transport system ATP-binding protein